MVPYRVCNDFSNVPTSVGQFQSQAVDEINCALTIGKKNKETNDSCIRWSCGGPLIHIE